MTQPAPPPVTPDDDWVEVLALPGGLRANVLGLRAYVGPTFVWADPAGLVGQLLADLTEGNEVEQLAATEYVVEYRKQRAALLARKEKELKDLDRPRDRK